MWADVLDDVERLECEMREISCDDQAVSPVKQTVAERPRESDCSRSAMYRSRASQREIESEVSDIGRELKGIEEELMADFLSEVEGRMAKARTKEERRYLKRCLRGEAIFDFVRTR